MMIGLGIAAIDPVGIALMPLFLLEDRPIRRAAAFLAGSFAALVGMGLIFSWGLGVLVIHFEEAHTWFIPAAETIGGTLLLGFAGSMVWPYVRGRRQTVHLPARFLRWSRLHFWYLVMAGAALVTVQSIADVVFVVAMVNLGRLRLSLWEVLIAVLTYALAALVLQAAVIGVYLAAPEHHRARSMQRLRIFLEEYSGAATAAASTVIGLLLLGYGLVAIVQYL